MYRSDLLGPTGRGAARQTATGRDEPRQSTTSARRPRHQAVARVSWRDDKSDAAIAIPAFADDIPKIVFHAQPIDLGQKRGRRHSCSTGGATPCGVVGIESAFGKRVGVRGRLDALGEIIDNAIGGLSRCCAIAAFGRLRVIREHRRAEGGDKLDGHSKQKGERRANVREARGGRLRDGRAIRLADRQPSSRRVHEARGLELSTPTAVDRDRVPRSQPQAPRASCATSAQLSVVRASARWQLLESSPTAPRMR